MDGTDQIREWKRLMAKIQNARNIEAWAVANRAEIKIIELEDEMTSADLNTAGREYQEARAATS